MLRQKAEGYSFWKNKAIQLAETFLWHALNGSVEHAKIIERHAGKRLWEEIKQTTDICLEGGYMLRPTCRPQKEPKRTKVEAGKTEIDERQKVLERVETGKNQADAHKNRQFSRAAQTPIEDEPEEPFSDWLARRENEMRTLQAKMWARPVGNVLDAIGGPQEREPRQIGESFGSFTREKRPSWSTPARKLGFRPKNILEGQVGTNPAAANGSCAQAV